MTLKRRYITATNSIKLTRLELTNDVSFYGSVNETSVDSALLSAALASLRSVLRVRLRWSIREANLTATLLTVEFTVSSKCCLFTSK